MIARVIRCPVITTKYLVPTNSNGARIKATFGSGASLVVPWDHAINADENHEAAVVALASKRFGIDPEHLVVRGGCTSGDIMAWTVEDSRVGRRSRPAKKGGVRQ